VKKKALICGVSGQDGALLAKFLLAKDYEVFGTSRDAQMSGFSNLTRMGILDRVRLESMSPVDFRSVLQVMDKVRPDEVYNFSGQSSVGLSFNQPVETLESFAIGTLNLLEVTRFLDRPMRLYNAGSGECFGDTKGKGADEDTPFRPRSPYAVAKAASFWEVANYREAYGLYACSGILFNHESVLRPPRFVTRKVVQAACRIAEGRQDKLILGDMSIRRDWGWAPEYIRAMWLMLQQPEAEDFVIATGECHSLEAFVSEAFSLLGLDWKNHVEVSNEFLRPSDISEGYGNPAKAQQKLGWKADYGMKDVVRMLVDAERGVG